MKIEIELSNYQLSFLNEMIADNTPDKPHGLHKEAKAGFYLITDTAGKLLKKAIDKKGVSKPFKIALKYYEAYALHQFLLTFIDYEKTEKRRVTREILGELNQKLT